MRLCATLLAYVWLQYMPTGAGGKRSSVADVSPLPGTGDAPQSCMALNARIHAIAVQVCRFELAPSPAMSTSLSSHDRSCLIRKFVAAAGKALPPPPPPPPAAPIAPPASQVSPHSAGAQFSARVDATHMHCALPGCVHCCARQRQLNVSCGGITTNAGCRSQGGRASLLGDIQRLRIPSEG